MATTEKDGLMTVRGTDGQLFLLYPITKADLVDGLDELLAEKAAAVHTHTAADIQSGTVDNAGVVQLSNEIDSASEKTAATSKALQTVNRKLLDEIEGAASTIGTRTAIAEEHAITTSTTMSYTNVTVTIPAKSYFCVTATAHYEQTPPKAVGFYEYRAASSQTVETCSAARGNYNATIALSGYTGENARDLHVYASYDTGDVDSKITLGGFYITNG